MELEYSAPAPAWADAISVFGQVRARGVPAVHVIPALLPNLHIRTRGWSRYTFGDGRVREAPRVVLLGATSGAFVMEVSADFEMICAGFLPEGWLTMMGSPAALFADEVVDAAALWPASAVDAMWHAIVEAPSFAARQAIAEAFLAERAIEGAWGDGRVRIIRAWLEQPCAVALADRIGVSSRHAGRLAHDICGLGTKTLAMKYRALRAAGAFALHGEAAMDRALLHYADQSHLIRDFQRFVGCTPCQFLREGRALARATMQGRWDAGVRSPMALLS